MWNKNDHIRICFRLFFSTVLFYSCGSLKVYTAEVGPLTIRYPNSQSENDDRMSYPVQLLELAFSKISSPYTLKPNDTPTTQSRALKLLESDSQMDVVWTMTNIERENNFLPVRIPILKGLIGWRIFIIKTHNQAIFDEINSLKQLKKWVAGQGLDWPDTQIMKINGLRVESSTSYEGLFDMLQKQRFEYFPRSVIEIWQELDSHPQLDLSAEQQLLLHYPTAMYYFVKKGNVALARNIERGLELAIADGSFDQLFTQFNQAFIKKARLEERKILQLSNPTLPPLTPLNKPHLWFKIQDS